MSLPQYVTNVTSFNDAVKILKNKGILTEAKKSEETGESVKELTEKYTTAYHNDLNALGVKKSTNSHYI